MSGRIPQWSHLVLDFCTWGVFFFFTNSISLLMIGLSALSITSWFSLGRLYVPRNLSVSSRLYNLLLIIVCIILLWLSESLWYWLFLLFHFLFCLFESFLFFSWWLQLKVNQFSLFFQKPALVSLIFSIVFLVSILFISSLIFIISFLLLT